MRKRTKYLIRTRFAKEIVAQVALPGRQTGKVAVLAGGLPGYPPSREVLDFLADQGYVAIGISYRGTWESEGSFLAQSPAKDIKDVIEHLHERKSFVDTYTDQEVRIRVKKIHLFGGSFGGPAVLLNSRHPQVDKVIAISSVYDWRIEGEAETFQKFVDFSNKGFGHAYRPKKKRDWQKLLRPNFYSPTLNPELIVPTKCFIIHATDDDIVPFDTARDFVMQYNIPHYFKPIGGHLGLSDLTRRFYWSRISTFLQQKNPKLPYTFRQK